MPFGAGDLNTESVLNSELIRECVVGAEDRAHWGVQPCESGGGEVLHLLEGLETQRGQCQMVTRQQTSVW